MQVYAIYCSSVSWDIIYIRIVILYTPALKFLQIFWPDDGLPRPKLVANIYINKIQNICF